MRCRLRSLLLTQTSMRHTHPVHASVTLIAILEKSSTWQRSNALSSGQFISPVLYSRCESQPFDRVFFSLVKQIAFRLQILLMYTRERNIHPFRPNTNSRAPLPSYCRLLVKFSLADGVPLFNTFFSG